MLELKKKLQELVEIPIIKSRIEKKLTQRKKKKEKKRNRKTQKKIKHPEMGVESIKDLLML